MCNYPEYLLQDVSNIFIPGNIDRKSKVIAVINFDVPEKEFELLISGNKSYFLDYYLESIYSVGDIVNLQEISLISNGYTGRVLKTEILHIHRVNIDLHILSFKIIKE